MTDRDNAAANSSEPDDLDRDPTLSDPTHSGTPYDAPRGEDGASPLDDGAGPLDDGASPLSDDVPREPSKHELDEAMAAEADRGVDNADGDRRDGDHLDDDLLAAPPAPEDDGLTGAPVLATRPPSRPAVIAGGVLAALLLGLAILATTQSPREFLPEVNKQMVAGVANLLEQEDVAEYTDDEVEAAQQAYADAGGERNMTDENVAQALNSAKPDSVTANEIEEARDKNEANYASLEQMESQLRSQIILFAVTGGLMALATVFYQRGKSWARYIGMFVAGFVAVMYVMQVVQGALNIPGMVITLAAVGAFYFFMKGRLEDPPAGMAGGGFGGFGGMFAPRGPRNRPAE